MSQPASRQAKRASIACSAATQFPGAPSRRRRILLDVHRRLVATAALVFGALLAFIGLMLFLNMLSLRDLVLETHLHPAIAVVFDTRDEMSHRRAQALEFLTGLAGLIVLLVAAKWLGSTRNNS